MPKSCCAAMIDPPLIHPHKGTGRPERRPVPLFSQKSFISRLFQRTNSRPVLFTQKKAADLSAAFSNISR